MILSKQDKETILRVNSIEPNLSLSVTKKVIRDLIRIIVLNYLGEESTPIPFLGELKINYDGDTINDGATEAKISIDINPNPYFLKIIGQIHDNKTNEISKELIDSELKNIFQEKLDE